MDLTQFNHPHAPYILALCGDDCKEPLNYIDKNHNKICIHKWNALSLDEEYKSIAKTSSYIGSSLLWDVSTVWIGFPFDAIYIFEMMIQRAGHDDSFLRFITQDGAKKAHFAAVEALSTGRDPLEFIASRASELLKKTIFEKPAEKWASDGRL